MWQEPKSLKAFLRGERWARASRLGAALRKESRRNAPRAWVMVLPAIELPWQKESCRRAKLRQWMTKIYA